MRRVSSATLLCGLVLALPTARAHHSFAAIYDFTKPVTVTGTVSLLEWTNPRQTRCQRGHVADSELVEHIYEKSNQFAEQTGAGAQR